MILPQLEENRHGVDVVGMFFFEDNNYVLVDGNPIGARLHKVAKEKGMLLMGCDQCCYEREIADKLFPRRADRLLPGSLQGALRQHAGPGHHALSRALTGRALPNVRLSAMATATRNQIFWAVFSWYRYRPRV